MRAERGSRAPPRRGDAEFESLPARPATRRDRARPATRAGKIPRPLDLRLIREMLSATCHCGAVRIEIPRRPRTLTNCNCSICRRYGPLWAYYKAAEVRITSGRGATASYAWGDRRLRFVRCATCGCIVNWERMSEPESGRVGINARNFEPDVLGPVRIRRLDGARTWRHLRDDE